jgi:hypothetical protein
MASANEFDIKCFRADGGWWAVKNEHLNIYACSDSYIGALKEFILKLNHLHEHYKMTQFEGLTGDACMLKLLFEELE